ncbi:MAG: hypothetical protein OHK0037_36310 [Elainellaceae cyanobacterium]
MSFADPLPSSKLPSSNLSTAESDVLYPQPFCPEAIAPRRRTPFDWVVNLMAIALIAAVCLSALLQFVFLALTLIVLAAALYGLYRLIWQLYAWQTRNPPPPSRQRCGAITPNPQSLTPNP